jgi:hypothetical protein
MKQQAKRRKANGKSVDRYMGTIFRFRLWHLTFAFFPTQHPSSPR